MTLDFYCRYTEFHLHKFRVLFIAARSRSANVSAKDNTTSINWRPKCTTSLHSKPARASLAQTRQLTLSFGCYKKVYYRLSSHIHVIPKLLHYTVVNAKQSSEQCDDNNNICLLYTSIIIFWTRWIDADIWMLLPPFHRFSKFDLTTVAIFIIITTELPELQNYWVQWAHYSEQIYFWKSFYFSKL